MNYRPQIYPLLIAISPILGLFADNYYGVEAHEILRPLIAVCFFIVVFYAIGYIMAGSLQKAALLSLIPVFALFLFRPAQSVVAVSISMSHSYFVAWFVAWGVVYLGGALWLRKRKALPSMLTPLLTWIGIAVVAAPIGNIIYLEFTSPVVEKKIKGAEKPEKTALKARFFGRNKPDIYYLLLDAHGREDILKSRYNLEKVGLIDSLRGMGFFVSDRAVANYSWTYLSTASTLNMTYLDEHIDRLNLVPSSEKTQQYVNKYFYSLANSSEVQKFLKSRDYTPIGNLFGYGLKDRAAPQNFFTQPSLNKFEAVLVKNTSLEQAFSRFDVSAHDQQRREIMVSLSALPELAKLDYPKFVFAHILAPHSPFVFDSNGDPVPSNDVYDTVQRHFLQRDIEGWSEWYKEGYAENVQGLGVHVEQAIRGILANSTRPPIIIVQSDHGPRLGLLKDIEKSDMEERMSVLSAFYLPGITEQNIPLPISSVNTFRFIFHLYFGQDLPYLQDRSFISDGGLKMYEVTDQVLPKSTATPTGSVE